MNTVQGKVLQADNNLGIPNLIVVIYDLDPQSIPNFNPTHGFPVAPQNVDGEVFNDENLSEEANQQILNFWNNIQADRIGSAITDSQGFFSLEYDDSAFKVRGNESRPDLVLFVLAPEQMESIGETNLPGFVPQTRILYYSTVPIANAGKTESTVIKISAEILEKHNIKVLGSSISPTSSTISPTERLFSNIAQNLDASKLFQASLQSKFAEGIKEKVEEQKEVDEKVNNAFKNFSLSSISSLDRLKNNYFKPGDNLLDNLKGLISKSTEVANEKGHIKRTRISLTRAQVENIDGLEINENGEVTGSAEWEVTAAIEAMDNTTSFDYSIDLAQECKATKEAKKCLDEIMGIEEVVEETDDTNNSTIVGSDEDLLSSVNAEDFINRQINRQLKKSTAPETQLRFEPLGRASQEDVTNNIQAFEVKGGPADATAFHDFYDLQIAFKHVWTEIFDGELERLGREMYETYRKLDKQVYGEENNDTIDEVNETYDLIRVEKELKSLRDRLANLNPPPESVIKLVPEITAVQWNDLTASEQSRLIKLAHKDKPQLGTGTGDDVVTPRYFETEQEWKDFAFAKFEKSQSTYIARDRDGDVRGRYEDALNYIQLKDWFLNELEGSINRFKRIFHFIANDSFVLMDGKFYPFISWFKDRNQKSLDKLNDFLEEYYQGNVVNKEQELATNQEKAQQILDRSTSTTKRYEDLIKELNKRILKKYKFDIFKEDSINYGLLVNYRQKWKPLTYQVGNLVTTIPLAPKEVRKYTKKEVVKKKRSKKEIENSLHILKEDSSKTQRVDAEIIERANLKTNFQNNVKGDLGGKIAGFNVGVEVSNQFSIDTERHSSKKKKDFREQVLKAAEEFKQERKLEVSFEETFETEFTESGEIMNPNDELTVTYLFYELQRQYEISEKIHDAIPVVLVANYVPKPDEIDDDWLLSYEWVLRRVLLDDSFHEAFDYLRDGFIADEMSVEIRQAQMDHQLRIVNEISGNVESLSILRSQLQEELNIASNKKAINSAYRARRRAKRATGFFKNVFNPFEFNKTGIGSNVEAEADEKLRADLLEAERRGYETRLEQAVAELDSTKRELVVEESALEKATDAYQEAIETLYTKRNLVDQLRFHVKDNVLHYMQAIWSYEVEDQRFFRLYQIKVPWIEAPSSNNVILEGLGRLTPTTPGNGGVIRRMRPDGTFGEYEFDYDLPPPPPVREEEIQTRKLVEIADLDNLIGFKGNYMIFPLKEHNYLTWFMSKDYEVHKGGKVRIKDPDEHYTTEELCEMLRCLREQNPEAFDERREEYEQMLAEHLRQPRKEKDIVIVPSNSLYIEALPGKHPILEDFKLIHRAIDVKKVQASVRHAELENIRLAARVLNGELDDPDVEKKIVVSGESGVNVNT